MNPVTAPLPPVPTAFYVEDHPVNAKLMSALFECRPGYRLVLADSGQHALRVAADMKTPPTLLLLDLRLPDCHGSELLTWLRRHPGWSRAPAVAVTAEMAGTAFDELWRKPMDLNSVLGRLDTLLGGRTRPVSPRCLVAPSACGSRHSHGTPIAQSVCPLD
jgi:CheY-like chemotaxis protein